MDWRLLTHEFAEEDFGFNFIGYVTGALGLGVAGRNSLRAMEAHGFRMRVVDYHLGDDRSDHDDSCLELGIRRRRRDPFPVNVFHVNPPEARAALGWGTIDVVDRFNACVPFWELTVLPPEWRNLLGAMDIVLAPTGFIEDVVRSVLPESLIIPYPQAVMLPEDVTPDRDRWGMREDATVFISSFDVGSDTNRKNPWAVIEAFETAFPQPVDEYLVLKVNAPRWSRAAFPAEVARLHEVAERDEHIVLIDELMPFEDVLTLYASSDVLVSLHRSEGLGLSLMEAMSLGKPVVATAYSGSMDFTTEENSCLVDYELIPVVSTHNAYNADYVGGEAVWADPDVAQAARYMQRLAQDAEWRRALGRRAAADMATRRADYMRCDAWEQIRGLVLDRESVLWGQHSVKLDALTRA